MSEDCRSKLCYSRDICQNLGGSFRCIFRKCFDAVIDLLITDIHPAIGFCAVVALANLSAGNEMQGFQRAAFVDKGIQCLVGRRCKGDHNGKSVTLIEDDLCI